MARRDRHHAGPYPFHDCGVNSAAAGEAGAWIEVRVASSLDAGEILSMLHDAAVAGAWEEPGCLRLYWPRDRWSADVLQELKRAMVRLGEDEPALAIETLAEWDWNAVWAASVKPFRIGRRLVIRPSWESVVLAPHEQELILDPKQAFGTGHHATTPLLIQWLEEVIGGGERVLDVGTGTGILAMAALRFGAGSAVGLDDDPVAVDCARSYAADNGFGSELVVRHGTLADLHREPFDLVVANLDRKTLLNLAGAFQAFLRAGGHLFVSGLLAEDRPAMQATYAAIGAALTAERRCDEWMALDILYPAVEPIR